MTVANFITIFRGVLILPILYCTIKGFALTSAVLLLIFIFLDMVDGFIARVFKSETILGRVLDPLMDKVLIIPLYFILLSLKIVPLWLVIFLYARELLILIFLIFLGITRSIASYISRFSGKCVIFTAIVCASLFLMDITWKFILYVIMSVVIFLSIVDYFITFILMKHKKCQ